MSSHLFEFVFNKRLNNNGRLYDEDDGGFIIRFECVKAIQYSIYINYHSSCCCFFLRLHGITWWWRRGRKKNGWSLISIWKSWFDKRNENKTTKKKIFKKIERKEI